MFPGRAANWGSLGFEWHFSKNGSWLIVQGYGHLSPWSKGTIIFLVRQHSIPSSFFAIFYSLLTLFLSLLLFFLFPFYLSFLLSPLSPFFTTNRYLPKHPLCCWFDIMVIKLKIRVGNLGGKASIIHITASLKKHLEKDHYTMEIWDTGRCSN